MAETDIDTVLGDDISFRGKLEFKNSLQINGRFRGVINTAGRLIVGPGAEVEADVQAGGLSVQGQLHGNVIARSRVELMKSARLSGDLRTPDLQIESGAKFSGHCIMDAQES